MQRLELSRRAVLGAALLAATAVAATAATAGGPAVLPHASATSTTGTYAEGASTPTGRLIQPVGRRTAVGDFPVTLAATPDSRLVLAVNSGQGSGAAEQSDESLQLLDVQSGKVVQTVRDHEKDAPTFYEGGAAWSRDGRHLYATGGGNDQVYDYRLAGSRLSLAHRWKSSARAGAPTVAGSSNGGIPGTAPLVGDAAAYSKGIAVLPDGSAVVVTNEQGSTVAAVSTTNGSVLWETPLGGSGQAGGAYPGAVVLSPDGGTAYLVATGLNAVVAVSTATGAPVATVPVGDHPTGLALTKDGRTLLVTNANDDSLSVVDASAAVPIQVAQLPTHVVPGEANGSSPTGVAVDDRTGRVYVALSGDNALLVLDAHRSGSGFDFRRLTQVGLLPSGYYPTAAAALPDGRVLVASAKGLGGAPITDPRQYIVNRRSGLVTTVGRPASHELPTYTQRARDLYSFPSRTGRRRPAGSPIPDEKHAGSSPIKHVLLIVRENRTFDQVFGDLGRSANVHPAYLQFGEKDRQGRTITPNAHALARRFGLSENFYSDGEASIQGHHWTAEGTSTDYTEKSYLHYYSDRNHPYDPTAPVVYPRCGALFQQLTRQGKSFRNFGELVGLATTQAPTAQAAPAAACATPGGRYDGGSVASFDPNLGANLSLTSVADTDKEQDIEGQLAPLVAADRLPQLMYAVLGNDHTDGTSAGKKTPQAHVATNDLAVGRLVAYLSHTPQWSSTAVFVVEDDSQDGLDHVDGHRNILLVASPWARKGALSRTHVDQASVLHTIELILGLAPMSSYTQDAAVPYDLFTSHPDNAPYDAVAPTYPMDATNPAAAAGTASSVPLDLSRYDVAGPVLEAQLWEATHPGAPMPPLLLAELRDRGGIRDEALAAWADGRLCTCPPLRDGLTVAPGDSDG